MKIDPDTFSDMSTLERCRAVFHEKNHAKILEMNLPGLGTIRSINRYQQVWKGLSRDAKKRVSHSLLSRNFDALQKLSRETSQRQRRILDAYLDTQSGARTIEDAIDIVDNGRTKTALEKRFQKRRAVFDTMCDRELDMFVTLKQEAIIASLKRKGIL